MRQIDGIAATNAINTAHPAAHVVVVTNDSPDLRNAPSAAGASAYVLKENLLELVPVLAQLMA